MKTVWLIGASSGIGLALAKLYAQLPMRLILSSRNVEALREDLAQTAADICFLPLDLEQPEQFQPDVSQTIDQMDCLDTVIFCAGKIAYDESWKMASDVERSIFEVNYWGPVNITKLLMPHLIKNQSGRLVYIGSISGEVPSPLRSTYGASKHALHGFVSSIRAELKQFNVGVSYFSPGFVNSGIESRSLDGAGKIRQTKDMNRLDGLSTDECANQIYLGIEAGKEELLIGGSELAMVPLQRYFPSLVRKLLPNFRPQFKSPVGETVDLPSGTSHYRLFGEGPVKIVITNGITSSFDVWDEVIHYFDPERYQVLLYNYYGRGLSVPTSHNFGLADFDNQLDQLLTLVDWKPENTHFVAYSWGCGWLSRWFNQKEVIPRSLTLLAPAYWKPEKLKSIDPIRHSIFGKWVFNKFGRRLLYLAYLKHCTHRYIAKAFWNKISGYIAHKDFIQWFIHNISEEVDSWPSQIKQVSKEGVPVFAISGDQDVKAFGGELKEFSIATGINSVLEIRNLNHLLPLENGLLVSSAIKDFIDDHE